MAQMSQQLKKMQLALNNLYLVVLSLSKTCDCADGESNCPVCKLKDQITLDIMDMM